MYKGNYVMQFVRNLSIIAVLGFIVIGTPKVAAAQAVGNGKLVTINAQDADLGALMSLIANQANINIVVDGSVGQRKVTLKLTRVSLQNALTAIERAYGLGQAVDGGVVHIG